MEYILKTTTAIFIFWTNSTRAHQLSVVTARTSPTRLKTMPERTRTGIPLSPVQLDTILTRFEQGVKNFNAIANEVGCSVICIRKRYTIFKQLGAVTAPRDRVLGRPRAVTQEAEDVRPTLFQRAFEFTCTRSSNIAKSNVGAATVVGRRAVHLQGRDARIPS